MKPVLTILVALRSGTPMMLFFAPALVAIAVITYIMLANSFSEGSNL